MSQVNFYMMKKDLVDFAKHILSAGDLEIYKAESVGLAKGEPLRDPLKLELGKKYVLVISALKNSRSLSMSPSIEFRTPELVSDTEMVNGRIFAKIGWLKTDEENKLFRSSYSRLERWLKKNYFKYEKTWWVSQESMIWSKAGGFLCLGSVDSKKVQLSRKE